MSEDELQSIIIEIKAIDELEKAHQDVSARREELKKRIRVRDMNDVLLANKPLKLPPGVQYEFRDGELVLKMEAWYMNEDDCDMVIDALAKSLIANNFHQTRVALLAGSSGTKPELDAKNLRIASMLQERANVYWQYLNDPAIDRRGSERMMIIYMPPDRKPARSVTMMGTFTGYGEDGSPGKSAGSFMRRKNGERTEDSVVKFYHSGRLFIAGPKESVEAVARNTTVPQGEPEPYRLYLPMNDELFIKGIATEDTPFLEYNAAIQTRALQDLLPRDELDEDGEPVMRVRHGTTLDGGNVVFSGASVHATVAFAMRPDVGILQLATFYSELMASMGWTQGRAIHKMLFRTVMFLAALADYNRAFGKYTILTKIARKIGAAYSAFVFGPYYTRTVLLSGSLFKSLGTKTPEQIRNMPQGSINMNADNGWAAKINGEDEIVTATPSDSWEIVRYARAHLKQIREYKNRQGTAPQGTGGQSLKRGMPWSREALDRLPLEYWERLAGMKPPMQGVSTALDVRKDGRAGVGDDRDHGFLSFLTKVLKWLKSNDIPSAWFRFIGKCFTTTKPTKFFDDEPVNGMLSNSKWRATLMFMLYSALVAGIYGVTAVPAAQILGLVILTMVFVPSLFGALLNGLERLWGVKGYGGGAERQGLLSKLADIPADISRWIDEKGSTTYLTFVLDFMDMVEILESGIRFHRFQESPGAVPAQLGGQTEPMHKYWQPSTVRRGLVMGLSAVFLLFGIALAPIVPPLTLSLAAGFIAAVLGFVTFVLPGLRSPEYKHRLQQYLNASSEMGKGNGKDFVKTKESNSLSFFRKAWSSAFRKTWKGTVIGVVAISLSMGGLVVGGIWVGLAGIVVVGGTWFVLELKGKKKNYEAVELRRMGSSILLPVIALTAVGFSLPYLAAIVPFYYLPLTMPLWISFLAKPIADYWDGYIMKVKWADRLSIFRGGLAVLLTLAMIESNTLQRFFGWFNMHFDPNTFLVSVGSGIGGMDGSSFFAIALQQASPYFMIWATFIIASTVIRMFGGLLWWPASSLFKGGQKPSKKPSKEGPSVAPGAAASKRSEMRSDQAADHEVQAASASLLSEKSRSGIKWNEMSRKSAILSLSLLAAFLPPGYFAFKYVSYHYAHPETLFLEGRYDPGTAHFLLSLETVLFAFGAITVGFLITIPVKYVITKIVYSFWRLISPKSYAEHEAYVKSIQTERARLAREQAVNSSEEDDSGRFGETPGYTSDGGYYHRSEVRLSAEERAVVNKELPVLLSKYLGLRAAYNATTGTWTPVSETELFGMKFDAAIVLGSAITDVPVQAAGVVNRLRENNPAMTVVTSGGYGPVDTKPLLAGDFGMPEAVYFKNVMEANGARVDIVEPNSASSGQNIRFSRKKIVAAGLAPKKILLMQNAWGQAKAAGVFVTDYLKEEGKTLASEGIEFVSYAPVVPDGESIASLSDADALAWTQIALEEAQKLKDWPAKGWSALVPVSPEAEQAIAALNTLPQIRPVAGPANKLRASTSWQGYTLGTLLRDVTFTPSGTDLTLTRSGGRQLHIRLVHSEGTNYLKIGNRTYHAGQGKTIVIDALLKDPLLWLGNTELVNFYNWKEIFSLSHAETVSNLTAIPANARLQPDLVPAQVPGREIETARRYLDALRKNLTRGAEFLPSNEEDQLRTLHYIAVAGGQTKPHDGSMTFPDDLKDYEAAKEFLGVLRAKHFSEAMKILSNRLESYLTMVQYGFDFEAERDLTAKLTTGEINPQTNFYFNQPPLPGKGKAVKIMSLPTPDTISKEPVTSVASLENQDVIHEASLEGVVWPEGNEVMDHLMAIILAGGAASRFGGKPKANYPMIKIVSHNGEPPRYLTFLEVKRALIEGLGEGIRTLATGSMASDHLIRELLATEGDNNSTVTQEVSRKFKQGTTEVLVFSNGEQALVPGVGHASNLMQLLLHRKFFENELRAGHLVATAGNIDNIGQRPKPAILKLMWHAVKEGRPFTAVGEITEQVLGDAGGIPARVLYRDAQGRETTDIDLREQPEFQKIPATDTAHRVDESQNKYFNPMNLYFYVPALLTLIGVLKPNELSLPPEEVVRVALERLGRLSDEEYARRVRHMMDPLPIYLIERKTEDPVSKTVIATDQPERMIQNVLFRLFPGKKLFVVGVRKGANNSFTPTKNKMEVALRQPEWKAILDGSPAKLNGESLRDLGEVVEMGPEELGAFEVYSDAAAAVAKNPGDPKLETERKAVAGAVIKLMDSGNPQVRWQARNVMGKILGRDIQDMLAQKNEAQKVLEFFRVSNNEIRGWIVAMLKSGTREPEALSDPQSLGPKSQSLRSGSSWVMQQIVLSSARSEVRVGWDLDDIRVETSLADIAAADQSSDRIVLTHNDKTLHVSKVQRDGFQSFLKVGNRTYQLKPGQDSIRLEDLFHDPLLWLGNAELVDFFGWDFLKAQSAMHGPFLSYLSVIPANARLQPDLVPAQVSSREIGIARRYLDTLRKTLARGALFLPSNEEDQLRTLHYIAVAGGQTQPHDGSIAFPDDLKDYEAAKEFLGVLRAKHFSEAMKFLSNRLESYLTMVQYGFDFEAERDLTAKLMTGEINPKTNFYFNQPPLPGKGKAVKIMLLPTPDTISKELVTSVASLENQDVIHEASLEGVAWPEGNEVMDHLMAIILAGGAASRFGGKPKANYPMIKIVSHNGEPPRYLTFLEVKRALIEGLGEGIRTLATGSMASDHLIRELLATEGDNNSTVTQEVSRKFKQGTTEVLVFSNGEQALVPGVGHASNLMQLLLHRKFFENELRAGHLVATAGNIDNIGQRPKPAILKLMWHAVKEGRPFTAIGEITEQVQGDAGGIPARVLYRDAQGRETTDIDLREQPEFRNIPETDTAHRVNESENKYFNPMNLYFYVPALLTLIGVLEPNELSLPPEEVVRVALERLGRLSDEEYARRVRHMMDPLPIYLINRDTQDPVGKKYIATDQPERMIQNVLFRLFPGKKLFVVGVRKGANNSFTPTKNKMEVALRQPEWKAILDGNPAKLNGESLRDLGEVVEMGPEELGAFEVYSDVVKAIAENSGNPKELKRLEADRKAVVAVLIKLMDSGNPQVRWQARSVMGKILGTDIQDMMAWKNAAGLVFNLYVSGTPETRQWIQAVAESGSKEPDNIDDPRSLGIQSQNLHRSSEFVLRKIKQLPTQEAGEKRSEIRTDNYPQVFDSYDPKQVRLGLVVNDGLNGRFYDGRVDGSAEQKNGFQKTNPVDVPWSELEAKMPSDPATERQVLYAYHNLYHLDWFVAYDGNTRKFYYSYGEPFEERTYSMFVSWKDGTVTSEDMRFANRDPNVAGDVIVYRAHDPLKSDLGDKINFAVFGQRIIENGTSIPLDQMAYQFSDINQVVNGPQFFTKKPDSGPEYGPAIGRDHLLTGSDRPVKPEDRPVITEAFRRDGYVEIDLTPYLNGEMDLGKYAKKGATPAEIRDAIEKGALQNWLWDYKKIAAKPSQEMKTGEYYIEGNTLHIKLTLARYPHNLIGITKSGKIAAVVLTGKKYFENGKGYTIPEVQEIVTRKQQEKGDPIVSVFLLANSKDAFKRVDGEFSAAESSPLDVIYQKGTAGIVVVAPKVERARSEVRNAGAVEVASMLANPMRLMGQDLTGTWLKLVGDKQIVSRAQDPQTQQDVEYGVRISADGKRLEHFAVNLVTGQEREDIFFEKMVGPFQANLVWNRTLRPSTFASQPVEVRRLKFEVPHDPETCSFDAGELALVNRPEAGRVTTHGRIWQVFHNVSPIDARGAFLLVPDLSKPENLRAHRLTPEDISDLTEMSFNAENISIFFDGPMSGASQNHIHAKIYPGKIARDAGFVAVRDASGRVLAENFSKDFPGLTIEEASEGQDAFVTRWSATSPEILARALSSVLPALDAAKLPFSAAWSGKDVFLVVREPGMDVLSELPGETWGSWQLINHVFSMENRKNYDDLTEAGIRSAMKTTIRSRPETVAFFAGALAVSRSEARENPRVLTNVRRGNEILRDIVEHPERDFDANIIVTTPASLDTLGKILDKNAGVLFHASRKPIVEPGQKGAGSFARLIDIWPALEKRFGKGFTLETLRGKTVSASLMSGLAKRLSLLIMTRYNQNKGLHPTASGERTGVEQTLWQRRLWLRGGSINAKDGMFVFSIDAAIAPEFQARMRPVEDPVFDAAGKLLKPGQGGFQVFGQEMSLDNSDIYGVTSEEDPNGLGVFLGDGDASKPGWQDIRLAVEKPSVEILTLLKREGKLKGDTILASHGNYYISWPAYFWITGKILELKQRFPNLPPLNWVEALFEAATFGEEYPKQFQKRYANGAQTNIGDDPELLEAIKGIAKEAREAFGLSFVNLGRQSYYLHANDAEQTWQIATKVLYQSEAARRLLGVGILGVDEWYRDQVSKEMWDRFSGRIVGPNVRIADHVTLGPRAIVVGNTVLEEGSDVSGYVRDSIGELDVPDNAAVFSVLLPGEKLTVDAGHFALQYLIKEDSHVKAVIGKVATGTRLWQRMSGGRTWADSHKLAGDLTLRELLKVVQPELTNRIYAEALSPEILRSGASMADISQGVRNALAAANVEMSQAEVRSEVRTQKLPTVSLDQFLASDFKGPVIIGGTGMIGSHLLEKLVREGKQVVVPVRAGISAGHVENLLGVYGALAKDKLEGRVTFVTLGDSLDPLKMDQSGASYELLKQMMGKATVVYHLAAQTLARPNKAQGETYEDFAVQTYVTNVFYTKLIARAAKELGKPMVYSSSQEVLSLNRLFPEPMAEPVTEKDRIPFHPVTQAFIAELQNAFETYVTQYVSGKAQSSPLQFTRELLNRPLVQRLDEPGKWASLIEAVNALDEKYYPAKELEFNKPADQQPRVTQALEEIGKQYPLDLLFGNYGISKILAEGNVLALGRAIVFRFVNVYGKGMHPNVISFYLDRLQANQEKVARGEAPAAIHVTDHMRDFMAAAQVAGVLSGAFGILAGEEKRHPQVLHVGTGHIYTMLEVLRHVSVFLGTQLEAITRVVEPHGDQPRKVMARSDYEALNRALPGTQPKQAIAEGLRAEAGKLEAQKRSEVRAPVYGTVSKDFGIVRTLDSLVEVSLAREAGEAGVLDVSKGGTVRYVVKFDGKAGGTVDMVFVRDSQPANPTAPSVILQKVGVFSPLQGAGIPASRLEEINGLIDQWAASMQGRSVALNPIVLADAEALIQTQPSAIEASKVPAVTEPVREETARTLAMQNEIAAITAAAASLQAGQLERQIPLNEGARRTEIRLTDLILGLKNQGVTLPPAFGADKGAYIAQYDKGLIEQILARKAKGEIAKGVAVVALVTPEQASEVKALFGTAVRVALADVNDVVAEQVRALGLKTLGRSLIQLKPGASPESNQDAYLTAALLANGRIVVVGTQQTVTSAVQISVMVMMNAAFEAAKAVAKSA